MALACATDGVGTAEVAGMAAAKGNAQSRARTGIKFFMDGLRFV